MSLNINIGTGAEFGVYAAIVNDLYDIVDNDGGLGLIDSVFPQYKTVNYQRTKNTQAAIFLDEMVNSTSHDIIITGVGSSAALPGGLGGVAGIGGVTFATNDLPAAPGDYINITYDITQDGGRNYYVFDIAGNRISMPNCIILFHELAHAWYIDTDDDYYYYATSAEREQLAIRDENVIRAEKNLNLRDENNQGGSSGFAGDDGANRTTCLRRSAPPVGSGSSAGNSGTDCYIASVCYGGTDVLQVVTLRRFKEEKLSTYRLGRYFIKLYNAYSPKLSCKLKNKKRINCLIRKMILDPIYHIIK